MGRRRAARGDPLRARSAATHASSTSPSPSAAASCASTRRCTSSAPARTPTLLGAYFADAGQHLEQQVYVFHDAPNTRSRVTYKGALQGDGARTVWVGDVLIGPKAVGTDTYEQNRNLVLTDGARADSVPNLEIETGDILGAGHASATGRFDDEQLFYLQSRGITEDEARRLVVRGFLAEIVQQIGSPALQERLHGRHRSGAREPSRGGGRTDGRRVSARSTSSSTNQAIRVVIDGVPIAVVKDSGGDVHAIGDTCTHGEISLSEGFVEDETLECWAHGSQFSLVTGKAPEPAGVRAGPRLPGRADRRRRLHRPDRNERDLEAHVSS